MMVAATGKSLWTVDLTMRTSQYSKSGTFYDANRCVTNVSGCPGLKESER